MREPYKVNIKKLIETAKRNNVALEINSNPVRLDLNGILARKAVEAGVKIIINTDAHSIDHLDYMEYGVGQARRGWVQKKDVINALPLARLKKFLKK